MKAAIIEDEINVQDTLKTLIAKYYKDLSVVTAASSVQSAVEKLNKYEPEIIFLDIHLPDGEGFEILNQLDYNPKVICTTAYESFAIEAIKHDVVDYLLKPIIPEELVEAIDKAINELEKDKKITNYEDVKEYKIVLKTKENIFRLKTNEVIYCEADGNYTSIYLQNEKPILLSKTLKKIEDLLSPFGFMRVHQSFLINPSHIKSLQKNTVKLSNDAKVKVSRRKKPELMKLLK